MIDQSQLKYFVEKFGWKLGNSLSKIDRDEWVRGIGEINTETQDAIISELDNLYMEN